MVTGSWWLLVVQCSSDLSADLKKKKRILENLSGRAGRGYESLDCECTPYPHPLFGVTHPVRAPLLGSFMWQIIKTPPGPGAPFPRQSHHS